MSQHSRINSLTVSFAGMARSMVFASLVVIVGVVVATASSSYAQTVAYWRFEEGAVGTQPAHQGGIPGSPTPILDSSGNGYHAGVLNSLNAPTYSSTIPSATIANSGLANTRSLDFSGNPQEIYASGYTGGGVNDIDLSAAWTVETSFRLDTINTGSTYAILSKDGKPVANKSEPPLVFRVRTDGNPDDNDNTPNITNHLEIRGLDGSGDDWNIDSRLTDPLVAGQWYHAAVVYDGTTTDLYLDSGSGYKFQAGSAMKTSGWFNSSDDWAIGRGTWNNAPVDWFDGQIDEVRISNAALSQQEFLHNDPNSFSDVVDYTIDTSQSFMTMGGSVFGFELFDQSPGSLTTQMSGTISARLNGNTLTFDDDLSDLDLLANPAGPFGPALGSMLTFDGGTQTITVPSTGEENLAFLWFPSSPESGQLVIRDGFFGISLGSADFDGPVTDLEIRTKSSRTDFQTTLFDDAGADLQGGGVSPNLDTGNLTRTIVGSTETITIPYSFLLGGSFEGTLLEGQIVASRSLGAAGDFDGDGDIDGSDFLIWQRGLGTTFTASDLADWQSAYGNPLSANSASAAVPEPSGLGLALLLALITLQTKKRWS